MRKLLQWNNHFINFFRDMHLNSVLVLSKITRYEFEKMRYQCSDEDLRQKLAERGSDIDSLLQHHNTHHDNLNRVLDSLNKRNIQAKLVWRTDYDVELLNAYDAIFTCGGDGTFLLAANRIHSPALPVIGLNTDPQNSEGYLCLPHSATKHFDITLDNLLSGRFKWLKRNRISVVLTGRDIHPVSPVKLHDQQLVFPEFRFFEHVKEYENHARFSPTIYPNTATPQSITKNYGIHATTFNYTNPTHQYQQQTTNNNSGQNGEHTPNGQYNDILLCNGKNNVVNTNDKLSETTKITPGKYYNYHHKKYLNHPTNGHHVHDNSATINTTLDNTQCQTNSLIMNDVEKKNKQHRTNSCGQIHSFTLPDLALNEIFIGESLSSRVSYYELSVDDLPSIKQKSSGLTICTGTGSSSWSFNINKIPVHSVIELFKIANTLTHSSIDTNNTKLMQLISKTFNDKLIFEPDEPRMAYTIRDPVTNTVADIDQPRGFANRIKVRSRCWDACIVIDGGYSFAFNDGCQAELFVDPENALLTVEI